MDATFDADKAAGLRGDHPGGNWSSYPPHKHDQDRPGEESVLEEIYYFEIGKSKRGSGIGYMRVYSSDDRPIDVLAEVRDGRRRARAVRLARAGYGRRPATTCTT